MVSRTPVHTDKAPAAVGPYSQGMIHGELLFCSGQVGLDPASGELVSGGVTAQARQCLENLAAVCLAGGTLLKEAVKITVYLADIGDWATVNEVYEEFFQANPPARVALAVAGLPKDAAVEMDAVVAILS